MPIETTIFILFTLLGFAAFMVTPASTSRITASSQNNARGTK